MKISIITPALNAADTICDTIASVIDQTYNDIEYILVDRGSKDETLSTFLSMRHSMDINRTKHIIVEEKDVFKAIEKGVEIATGDIIAVLGAGDFYSSDDVISSVMEEFSTGRVSMVYGDMKFVNTENTQKVTRRTCGRFYRRWPKTSGMTKCHPALFMTKELFLQSGGYRYGFPHAADYEMMVRLLSDRDNPRKYLRKEMVSIRQDKVNSLEAEAYRKELLRAFELNDKLQTNAADSKTEGKEKVSKDKDSAKATPSKSSHKPHPKAHKAKEKSAKEKSAKEKSLDKAKEKLAKEKAVLAIKANAKETSKKPDRRRSKAKSAIKDNINANVSGDNQTSANSNSPKGKKRGNKNTSGAKKLVSAVSSTSNS